MTYEERRQISYLQSRKDQLLDQFIGACEEINKQIKEVRNGRWATRVKEQKTIHQNEP